MGCNLQKSKEFKLFKKKARISQKVMKINFFVLLFIAIISSLNINTVKCLHRIVTRGYYYGRPRGRGGEYRYKYSEEHVYEEEEPEKPKPKPEEPKPESKKDWTLGNIETYFKKLVSV